MYKEFSLLYQTFIQDIQQNWSISLGKLLCSLKDQQAEQFTELLSSVRSEQTQALLNANFGSGGHTQAYQSMLRQVFFDFNFRKNK